MLKNWKWKPPGEWLVLETVDMHTGGEPLRVFIDGVPEIKGKTILEKRKYFSEHFDFIRKGTMLEPRGHADMYGAILTEPVTRDGDFGVFFMHNQGYSTMCGHAILALTKLVLDTGMIRKEGTDPVLKIDGPPGRIVATGHRKNGIVQEASFLNVPSFVLLQEQMVEIPGIGRVAFDVAFGGAFYAFCDAKALALNLDGSEYNKLIDYGKRIKKAVAGNFIIRHPFEEDLSFLYGTIFTGDPYDYRHHSRNVCIFAEGEVDRSATGSGVSARAALHFAKKELNLNEKITIESILGSTMDVRVVEKTTYGDYDAIIPEVTGTAYITGQNTFCFDPEDPFKEGFIFR
jgi:proline racemase